MADYFPSSWPITSAIFTNHFPRHGRSPPTVMADYFQSSWPITSAIFTDHLPRHGRLFRPSLPITSLVMADYFGHLHRSPLFVLTDHLQESRRDEPCREGGYSIDRHHKPAVMPDALDVAFQPLEHAFGHPYAVPQMVLAFVLAEIFQTAVLEVAQGDECIHLPVRDHQRPPGYAEGCKRCK